MNLSPFLKSLFLFFAIVFVLLGALYYFDQPLGNTAPANILLPPLSRLDIPPKTMDGITATVESYYADASRLIFTVRVVGADEVYYLDQVSINKNLNQSINAGGLISSAATPSVFLIDFSTEIPLEEEQLKGGLSFTVFSPGDENISAEFQFNFDIPVHPALTFNPKQSFLSINGMNILLDRVVITPAHTQAYLCYTNPSDADWMIGSDATLKIGNQQASLNSYSLLFDSALGDMGKGGEVDWTPPVETGRCVKIGFPIGDANPQSITLTIPSLEQSMPEVIPADELAMAIKYLKDWENVDMEWHIVDHGAYPEWIKLPAGMSEQEAYRKFIGALGYMYNGQWKFNLQLNPQKGSAPIFSTSTYGMAAPIQLPVEEPRIAVSIPGYVRSFGISPDKKFIAIATSQGVYLYDLAAYKRIGILSQPQNVSSIAWAPDGTKLAVGSVDSAFGKSGKMYLAIWDTSTWKVISEPEINTDEFALQYDALAWSPDSALLATATYERGVVVLNVQTKEVVSQQTGFIVNPYRIAWSPDSSRLVATGDLGYGFRRWRADTDEFVRLYDQRVNTTTDIAWSPDGVRIASTHENGAVCFWTVETNICDGFIQAHINWASSLAWSADGNQLATAAGAIRIWDTQTGIQVSAFGQTEALYLQLEWLSPDTLVSLVSGDIDGAPPAIRVFDITTGNIVAEFH